MNLICRKAAVDGYFISPRYTFYREDEMRRLRAAVHTEERDHKGEDLCTLDMPLQKGDGHELHQREFQRGRAGADFGADAWNG